MGQATHTALIHWGALTLFTSWTVIANAQGTPPDPSAAPPAQPPPAQYPPPAQPPPAQPPPAQYPPAQYPPAQYPPPTQYPPPYPPPGQQYEPPAPYPPGDDATVHHHDGFYFRVGLGFGPGWLTETVDGGALGTQKTQMTGLTANFQLLFGGTPAEGFVIGGLLDGQSMVDPTVKIDGQEISTRDTTVGLSTLGLFASYYPDAHGGLNFLAFAGYGQLTLTIDGVDQNIGDLTGIVLGGGVGYDFWVGKQWSIGPAARLTYGSLGDEQNGMKATETWVSPSLAFVVTFH